jgi:hypothetical protein
LLGAWSSDSKLCHRRCSFGSSWSRRLGSDRRNVAGNELLDTLSFQIFQAQGVGEVFPLLEDLVKLRDAFLLTPCSRLFGIVANAYALQPSIEAGTEALLALQARKKSTTDTSNFIVVLASALGDEKR